MAVQFEPGHVAEAAVIMSLEQSKCLNDCKPHAYLKNILERLSTWPNCRIAVCYLVSGG